jgi:YD repeat-containing protein
MNRLILDCKPLPKRYAHLTLGTHYDSANRIIATVTPDWWDVTEYTIDCLGRTIATTRTSRETDKADETYTYTDLDRLDGVSTTEVKETQSPTMGRQEGRTGHWAIGPTSKPYMRVIPDASWYYSFSNTSAALRHSTYGPRGELLVVEQLVDNEIEGLVHTKEVRTYTPQMLLRSVTIRTKHGDTWRSTLVEANIYDKFGRITMKYTDTSGTCSVRTYTYEGGTCAWRVETEKLSPRGRKFYLAKIWGNR